MIDQHRIKEAEANVKNYIDDNWITLKHNDIFNHAHFFLKNSETSLLTAQTLLELSENNVKKEAIHIVQDFESFLWVVVSSYYSMFYASLALFARHHIKVGDKSVHKVVADLLITQFMVNNRLAKLLQSYEDSKEAALTIIGTEKAHEFVDQFDMERRKRHTLQYELGAQAKQNLARTSVSRASAFVAVVRNILCEK